MNSKHCPECGVLVPDGPKIRCSSRCRGRRFRRTFKERNGITYRKLKWHRRKQHGASLRAGIYRVTRDGRDYWAAHIKVGSLVRKKHFQIKRLGNTAARLAASLQRMVWMLELRQWKPDEGDPFGVVSLPEMLSGNADYASSVVSDVSSPWVLE